MFILTISATELSRVPGLSAAGANVDVLPYTAPADADLLCWGRPRVIDAVPVDPMGHPTPAIITRAAQMEASFPAVTLRAGSFLPPAAPHVEMGTDPGKDPRLTCAVPKGREIFERARDFAGQIARGLPRVVLAESIPGGTTTAYLLLRALGYNGMVSSAGPDNPVPVKEQVWRDVQARLEREGRPAEALDLACQVGDPMQLTVAGLIAGLPVETEITLAGGTQMLAVAALIRHIPGPRAVRVATTIYVARDRSAHFSELASQIGVHTWTAPLDFSASPWPGLADYEKGYVKEGVGAGGAVWYAMQLGVSVESIVRRTEALYAEMTGASS